MPGARRRRVSVPAALSRGTSAHQPGQDPTMEDARNVPGGDQRADPIPGYEPVASDGGGLRVKTGA